MKRSFLGMAAVLAVMMLLCGCGGRTLGVQRIIGDSERYSRSEIRAAMTVAERSFTRGFRGCTLLRLEYDEAESAAEAAEWAEQYDAQEKALLDEVTITELQIAEYEDQVAKRQLRAGISGTITYVRKVKNGERSVAGDRFISIADATLSIFRAETELWDRFEPGQECVITVRKVDYEAVVASEAELGLPETEKVQGEREYVYLKLKNPTFDLEDGDRGTLTLVLDSREDVLIVPASAVSSANGQKIVYYQNEEGMKAYKPVETGLEANKMVEIISGLEEGESVIVE